jgi:hypothetical protein
LERGHADTSAGHGVVYEDEAGMAKANKTPDPAEAALSAIEEALNGRATGTDGPLTPPAMPRANMPKMNMPRVKMPKVDKEPEVTLEASSEPIVEAPALLPPAPANEPMPAPVAPAPSLATPPRAAANDDKRNGAALLSALQQRPSRAPLWLATLMSLGWLALAAYYVFNTYHAAILSSGGYLAEGNLPLVVAIAVAALLPVIFMFSAASMVRRAQEMRIAARAMTEAALRLVQPEAIASDSVFSLGQAIRREVASMGVSSGPSPVRASWKLWSTARFRNLSVRILITS